MPSPEWVEIFSNLGTGVASIAVLIVLLVWGVKTMRQNGVSKKVESGPLKTFNASPHLHCSVEVQHAMGQMADTLTAIKMLLAESTGTQTSIGHILERLEAKANDSSRQLEVLLDRTKDRRGFRGGSAEL